MRSISTFFVLFSILLFANLMDARKDPKDYWKSIMKGEPMPKAIEDLVHLDPPASDLSNEKKELHTPSETINMNRFIKDFDTRPNVIIYHSHVKPKDVKPFIEDFKPRHDTEPEAEKSFAKPVESGI
uniref:Putative Organ specific protein n=1 Tax=Davidia involucrata TaxID=16924 RepID=A0A5B7CBJ7_DAVIN